MSRHCQSSVPFLFQCAFLHAYNYLACKYLECWFCRYSTQQLYPPQHLVLYTPVDASAILRTRNTLNKRFSVCRASETVENRQTCKQENLSMKFCGFQLFLVLHPVFCHWNQLETARSLTAPTLKEIWDSLLRSPIFTLAKEQYSPFVYNVLYIVTKYTVFFLYPHCWHLDGYVFRL